MGHEYEAESVCYLISLVHNQLYCIELFVLSVVIWGLSRWLFLSRVVFLSDGHEQTHFYCLLHPSSLSPRTRSLLLFSVSVCGWEDVQGGLWHLVCLWLLGWPCDDIISTSAPVLPCNLDTIPLMTPELCQRSGWKGYAERVRSGKDQFLFFLLLFFFCCQKCTVKKIFC